MYAVRKFYDMDADETRFINLSQTPAPVEEQEIPIVGTFEYDFEKQKETYTPNPNYPAPPPLPKEAEGKAKELVDKFKTLTMVWDVRKEQWADNLQSAKQCALISINREIDLINRLLDTNLNNDFDLLRERGELQDVRTAINQI